MKTWLITGCSSGIGRGIAKAVLEKGDQAVVTARDVSTLDEFVQTYPKQTLAVKLDITKKEDIDNVYQQAIETFGCIDVVVNNAGYGYRSSIEEAEKEDVELLFNTNFFGPIALINKVLPHIRANKSGAIINVSSIAAVRSAVGSGYYASSKASLELVTDALAKEVSPLGIKVMIVEPGSFRTHFYDTSLKGTKNKIDDYNETAGKTRKENIVNLKNQPGDPEKAGKVIVEAIEQDNYPLRLLLGSDAVRIVSTSLKERIEEIEEYKQISIQTDY